jgi:hypothetical protein
MSNLDLFDGFDHNGRKLLLVQVSLSVASKYRY